MKAFAGYALKTLAGVAAGALLVSAASAADLAAPEPVVAAEAPSLIDVAFGVAGVTDYRFRGITQSKKDPAVQGYAELQVADWFYAGVWGSSVNFPRPQFTDASMEVDFYAGLRHSWGAFGLDVGGLYYWYPGESTRRPPAGPANNLRETDYWEIYAKPSISFGDWGSIAGNAYWTSDYVNTGSDAFYLAVLPKVNIPLASMPDLGFYVSGELGKQWIKKTTVFGGANYNPHDYLTWNIGAGVTYKAMSLDVRYSDTDLSKKQCALNSGVRGWCGDAVVAKLAFDTSLSKLK